MNDWSGGDFSAVQVRARPSFLIPDSIDSAQSRAAFRFGVRQVVGSGHSDPNPSGCAGQDANIGGVLDFVSQVNHGARGFIVNPTKQQQAVIARDVRPGEILLVNAYAGSGKTTTLELVA